MVFLTSLDVKPSQVTINTPKVVEYGDTFELRGEIINTGRSRLAFESPVTVDGEYVNCGSWDLTLVSPEGKTYYFPLVFVRRDIHHVHLRRNMKYDYSFKVRLDGLSENGFFRSEEGIPDGEYELILKIKCTRPRNMVLSAKTGFLILNGQAGKSPAPSSRTAYIKPPSAQSREGGMKSQLNKKPISR